MDEEEFWKNIAGEFHCVVYSTGLEYANAPDQSSTHLSSHKNVHINAYHRSRTLPHSCKSATGLLCEFREQLPTTTMHHPCGPSTSTPIGYKALDEQCEVDCCSTYTVPAMLYGHEFLWSDSGNVYIARRTSPYQGCSSFRCELSPWWWWHICHRNMSELKW
jgi:hypothetical protein